jgi:hypothetical protein
MGNKRDNAFRRLEEKKEAKINKLLQEREWCKSEIEAGHHIIRNQFKLLNIRDRLKRVR